MDYTQEARAFTEGWDNDHRLRLTVGYGASTPSITGCGQRFELATERYLELSTLLHETVMPMFRTNPVNVSFRSDPRLGLDDPHVILPPGFEEALSAPLARANALASEVVHYARSSLDHMVNYLAWLDSGSPQAHVQLFLAPNAQAWKSRRRTLKGISEEHLQLFDRIQPFNGVEWTASLRTLSNFDKHTDSLRVCPVLTFSMDASAAERRTSPIEGHSFLLMGNQPELEFYLMADSNLERRMESVRLAVINPIFDGISSLIMHLILENDAGGSRG